MMTKRFQGGACFLIALFVALLVACPLSVGLPKLEKDDVVVAFGDSITFGTGAAPHESYPVVLEKLIGRRVVNAGVPGEVTAGGMARLPKVLEREKPALVIICLGGNDLLRSMNKKQAADNIREMIHLTRKHGADIMLIGVPVLGLSVSPESFYSEIAKEMNVSLEEKALSEILADSALKADLIHPNAAGYRRLAEAIAVHMKKSGAIE
ncbi:MAG: arylesterase [Smithellaceae bacterium]|nr:arylesterase [Smithellaceae bacterium]